MIIVVFNEIIGGQEVKISKKSNLKNIYLRIVPPDGNIKVSAPIMCRDEEIRNFVLKKMPQISMIQNDFKNQPRQTKREYVSGEAHYLWGKPYMLEVKYGNKKSEVIKNPERIVLKVPDGTDEKKRESILTEWYRTELKRNLEIVSKKCEQNTGIKADEYRVKNMKTKWGTCNIESRRIWINLQLIKKPLECLEYVVTHELVHLIERNHTNRFSELVDGFYPGWRQAKKKLSELPLDYYESNQEDD